MCRKIHLSYIPSVSGYMYLRHRNIYRGKVITGVNTLAFFDYIFPLALAVIPAIMFAFKQTFNAGWAPAMVVFDVGVAKAFMLGHRAILRRGARVFSTAFVICLLAIVLSLILGLYALIIILPIVLPFSDIFEMTAFFSSQGMRFYADYDTILTPKKLEEVDKIENAKFIL